MGIKNLWSVLTPHAERKPICELRGKTVAIDLAGWVCESLNVVDYFVHPRHHLKNLFFRACYLIWEEVTPVFVLEGVAPKLKSQVIEKRNELQFRGAKPKDTHSHSCGIKQNGDKGRTRFNHVLKQCENLLNAMGFKCIQGPGEAEAYCAFLNSKGLVDGVISQDSDCFAYGALRVYRNFSVSTQGALAAQGGAVDIYDMNHICSKIDFGQNKVIVMALLSGCDYCPDGVGGVGRDSVLKLFNQYGNNEILKRIRSWRLEDDKYSTLELKVDDKTICYNCGHIGRTQSHTKNGCGICRTNRGCDETLWKEERLALKSELALRKKALADPSFPSEEIIDEFLKQPEDVPILELNWCQPNMVKFMKQIGHLLQWPEIYCFQKFFPVLTRWYILKAPLLKDLSPSVYYVSLKKIIKKRVVKGVPSLELLWEDTSGVFNGLIPDDQLKEFLDNNPKGLQDIWSTVEPFDKVKIAYPSLVESFLKSKEKPKKSSGNKLNLNNSIEANNGIVKSQNTKRKTKKCNIKPRLELIDRFLKQKYNNSTAYKLNIASQQCSTPITKSTPSDLESDVDNDGLDMSDIVNEIVRRPHKSFELTSLKGKKLCYDSKNQDISILLSKSFAYDRDKSVDDFYIPASKKLSISNSFCESPYKEVKRKSLDDSFDVLVKRVTYRNLKFNKLMNLNGVSNFVDRFKQKQLNSSVINKSRSEKQTLEDEKNVSFFFNDSYQQENEDAFERLIETMIGKQQNINKVDDFIVLSD